MYLEQPGFTYGAFGPITKNSQHIYQNELDKTCFEHEMAYEDYRY